MPFQFFFSLHPAVSSTFTWPKPPFCWVFFPSNFPCWLFCCCCCCLFYVELPTTLTRRCVSFAGQPLTRVMFNCKQMAKINTYTYIVWQCVVCCTHHCIETQSRPSESRSPLLQHYKRKEEKFSRCSLTIDDTTMTFKICRTHTNTHTCCLCTELPPACEETLCTGVPRSWIGCYSSLHLHTTNIQSGINSDYINHKTIIHNHSKIASLLEANQFYEMNSLKFKQRVSVYQTLHKD